MLQNLRKVFIILVSLSKTESHWSCGLYLIVFQRQYSRGISIAIKIVARLSHELNIALTFLALLKLFLDL